MRSALRLALVFAIAANLALAGAAALATEANADITVVACDTYQPFNDAPAFSSGSNDAGTQTFNTCLPSGGLGIWSKGAQPGFGAWWFADVPSGWLTIAEARAWFSTPYCPDGGMTAELAWNHYGQNAGTDPMCGRTYVDEVFSSPVSSFGWRVWCNQSTGCHIPGSAPTITYVQGVWLDVREAAIPSLTPVGGGPTGHQNLWYHGGAWVRGDGWPVDLVGGDITGVCQFIAALDSNWVARDYQSPDQSQWHQCDQGDTGGSDQNGNHAQRWSASIDLSNLSDGWHTYQISDQNAAGNWGPNDTEQVGVDNSPISLSLSGPTSAPVTAGTQYLTAKAASGPSGVGAIKCSDDGSPWTSEPLTDGGVEAATAAVPVSGIGIHNLRCYAANQAVDSSGAPATSAVQTWTVKIGEPVDAGITFARVTRTCRRVRVHKHHRTRHVLHCHTTTQQRRVERVRYGRRATIRGWFATADGAALGHVPVIILSAPNNGLQNWRRVETVSTAADGSWSASLPAGPSRLIEATYSGGPLTADAISPVAEELVPANSTLSFSHVVHFGHFAHFSGRLLGGYVPPTGAIVVVQALDRGQWRGIATVRTNRRGAWSAQYAVNGGTGSYPVRVRIPRQADYPWTAAVTASQTLVVQP